MFTVDYEWCAAAKGGLIVDSPPGTESYPVRLDDGGVARMNRGGQTKRRPLRPSVRFFVFPVPSARRDPESPANQDMAPGNPGRTNRGMMPVSFCAVMNGFMSLALSANAAPKSNKTAMAPRPRFGGNPPRGAANPRKPENALPAMRGSTEDDGRGFLSLTDLLPPPTPEVTLSVGSIGFDRLYENEIPGWQA